jgi:hypothetical protein
MKNSVFAVLFLAVSAFSFFQCQKDNSTQNIRHEPGQQVLEERGGNPPCPITFTTDVRASVCGTDLSNTLCQSCGGFGGTGSVNVNVNGTITFYPVTLIFTVRNLSTSTGNFTLSNVNGTINFVLAAGECRDFTMNGCDII